MKVSLLVSRRKALLISGFLAYFAAHSVPAMADEVAESDQAVTAVDQLGFTLLKKLKGSPTTGNKFISPFSAFTALSVLAEGADDSEGRKSYSDITKVLGINVDQAGLSRLNKKLISTLKSSSTDFTLGIANAVWLAEENDVNSDFRTRILDSYDGAVRTDNFADPDVVGRINQWASNATNGKIDDVVSSSSVNSNIEVFFANATYFKATWTDVFQAASTTLSPFTTSQGSAVSVPFLNETGNKNTYLKKAGRYEALMKTYGKEKTTAMVILKPEGTLENLLATIDSKEWQSLLASLASTDKLSGSFSMPKLKFKFDAKDFQSVLAELGMKDVFIQGKANLSRMTDSSNVSAGAMFLKSYVAVDEKGTEAAAVTGGLVGAGIDAYNMKLNKPYLFGIVHLPSKTLLFLGAIQTPEGGVMPVKG